MLKTAVGELLGASLHDILAQQEEAEQKEKEKLEEKRTKQLLNVSAGLLRFMAPRTDPPRPNAPVISTSRPMTASERVNREIAIFSGLPDVEEQGDPLFWCAEQMVTYERDLPTIFRSQLSKVFFSICNGSRAERSIPNDLPAIENIRAD